MIPDDQLRFLTGMMITLPLSFALRYIPSYSVRIYYSLFFSLCLQFYTYGSPSFLPLSLHVLMYYVIKNVKRQQCGSYATIISIALVSLFYIYVMIVDYGRFELDVSTTLMMSVCKYSLFAFSYQDGLQDKKEQNKQRIQQKIQQFPSFFQYFNYMVFLPTCLINTPFSYSLFDNYMKKDKQFKQIPLVKLLKKLGKQSVVSLICVSIYTFSLLYFPVKAFSEETYLTKGVLHHIWYSYISINLFAIKFFFGFLLMQLPVHASGISYKPSSDDQFEGIKTIKIYQFEKAYHLRDKIASWNMAVQQWLRKCIYERLPYNKETKQFLTFVISALWHGFYPGIYVTFILYFLQIYTGNIIYKFSRENQQHPLIQFYNKTQKYSFYICWLIWNLMFVNNSAYFIVLTMQDSYEILKAMKFANPLILLGLIVFFKVLSAGKQKQKNKTL